MIALPDQARQIIDALSSKGYEAYAVGGSVRDLLMNKPTKHWDFTTNATPQEILAVFPDSFYDNQFGTVGIKIRKQITGSGKQKDEVEDVYEVTTYRSESGYTDKRHPDIVTWGKSILDDLSRRDFTINAIATDGKTLVDPFDGRADIDKKIIRTVGDPSLRFSEDALRLMRAVRIASQLGFTIETHTASAIQRLAPALASVSAERIRDELFKLLISTYAADGMLMLKNTGLLSIIIPELIPAFRTEQKGPKRHHIYDVGTHSVMALKNCNSTDPLVRLATLIHDIGKPQTYKKLTTGVITFYNHEVVGSRIAKTIAQRLRLSKKDADRLFTLVRWHQFTVDERQTDAALRRFLRRVGKENLPDMLTLRIGDRLGGGARETSWRLELFKKRLEEVQKQPFTVADLKITGHDVMRELGIQPGPKVGEVLLSLFSEVEKGSVPNDRNALLAKLNELKGVS